ncbi:response regulator PleD [Geobacter sp. OR-1]|uniref:diguanylate cyclase n=1 Tax=Geobacter sp. OR-1 TaxID=1266765 RepID=UPI0005423816|nr:diguanylate cyclase [Geobacter sp. OR-1]GAM09230.1 response regulator PleD [Geobacter sp. OR-1]
MSVNMLIIDDSDKVREQIIHTLQSVSFCDQYLEARDGLEGFKILIDNPTIDLILCDLEMPRMDGFKFITMVRSRDDLKSIPVIILTARETRELKIKGLEQGASDYVTKPFDPGELVARVKVQLKLKLLQDELKRSNEMLKELSNTDPLTQLFNRRYMMEVLDREIQRTARKGSPISILLIDIDHFKKVNDTYGHQLGDVVLVNVANVIRKYLRTYDVAARYGGEEFVAILPETPLDEAITVAERIRAATQQSSFSNKLQSLKITISIGVATFPMPGLDSVDDLIRIADEGLYRAKSEGRNRVITLQQVTH